MLEAEPSNQKQQYIFEGDVNKYCLSQENMDYLTEVHLEVSVNYFTIMSDDVLQMLCSLRKKLHNWSLKQLHYEKGSCHCGLNWPFQ